MFFSIPYGGPVAMVWGVSARSCASSSLSKAFTVVRLLVFLDVHRHGHGRAGFISADCRGRVLLDIPIFFAPRTELHVLDHGM
jgi:hypothetical protein